MINKAEIGKIIQTLRKNRGVTQEELAEKIGLSTNYLSKVERGLNVLNAEAFLKMADALKFTFEDFGINVNSGVDETKDKLFKIILSSSEKETRAYLRIIETLRSVLLSLK